MKTILYAGILVSAGWVSPAFAAGASSAARADALLTWNEVIAEFTTNKATALAAPVEARAYAMTFLAMERAILAVHDAAQPIGSDDAKEQAAASAAARDILIRVCPAAAVRLDEVAATHLAAVALQRDRARALDAGRAAARHVLSERESDSWGDAGVDGISALRLSLPVTANTVAKSPWLKAAPFGLKNAGQFSVRLPYWHDITGNVLPDPLITRTRLFEKVDRATAGAALAQVWSGSPVVAWNRVANALVTRAGLDLVARARVLALVNAAMADATLAALHAQAVLGRPQSQWRETLTQVDGPPLATDHEIDVDGTGRLTAFREGVREVLSAPMWNYPARSATVASAACAALGAIRDVEKIPFEFTPTSARGVDGATPRKFSSVRDAARECAFAASLDGKNSREACVAGYHLGEEIGGYLLKRMRAQKR